MLEHDVVGEGAVGAAAVRERDVVDVDREPTLWQALRVRRRRRADRHVEHAEHPAQAGDSGLGLVEHLGELGDRFEVAVREEDEADERARGEPALGPDHHADA